MTGLAVAALTLLVYLLAPSGGFLAWDDRANLLAHDAWRGLGWTNVKWMLTTHHQGPWQPLSWLSWAADHALWGLDAQAFRRTNIVLHALAAGLLTECARLLLKPAGRSAALGAAAAGLFFALHPLRVESVVWITERRDVLSGALYAGALLAFLRGRRGLSLALFAAALTSKATAVGLAWAVLALATDRRRAAPYFALALAAGWLNLGGFQTGDLRAVTLGWGERLVVAAHALSFYLAKTLAPFGLSPYYPLPSPAYPLWPWAAAGVALSVGALWSPLYRHWLVYALTLAPVSGLLQNGAQAAADRYSYLATLPFALLAGVGVSRLRPRAAVAALAAGAVFLAGLTLKQAAYWRDDVALWTRAAALAPDAYLPRSNLALALDAAGDLAGAAAQYREAIRLEPRDVEARVNLGVIRAKAGDVSGAQVLYREALGLRPGHPHAAVNLAVLLASAGRRGEAIAVLRGAPPAFAPARFNLGLLLLQSGRKDEGLAHLREALRLDPALAARLRR